VEPYIHIIDPYIKLVGPYRFIILLLQMVEQQDLDLELEGTRSKVTMNLVPRPVPPSLPTPLLIMLVFRGQVSEAQDRYIPWYHVPTHLDNLIIWV
jgi:hypothetical protein